jgi:hypothetical protein
MNRLVIGPLRALSWLLCFLPVVFACAYTALLLTLSGLTLAGQSSPALHTTLIAGLWGYAALAVINFYVVTVFGFCNCCIGLETFPHHLRHDSSPLQYLIDLAWSVVWPANWYLMLRGLVEWGVDWIGIALEPTVYWINTHRQGHRADVINFDAGVQETIFYK